MHTLPKQHRLWRLLRYPAGNDFAAGLALETVDLPLPAEGEVLIRNEFLSLDATVVRAVGQWADHFCVTPAEGALAGETVLVSAAAGATGMLAAQVAKIMGCRVIGLAGGQSKCRFLRDTLRLDAAPDSGRITMPFDVTPGLENVLSAFFKLFVGGNIGKGSVALQH